MQTDARQPYKPDPLYFINGRHEVKTFYAHISLENTDNHKRDMMASERAANNHLLRHLFPLSMKCSIINDQRGTSEVFRFYLLRGPLPPRRSKTFLSANSRASPEILRLTRRLVPLMRFMEGILRASFLEPRHNVGRLIPTILASGT